MENNTKIAIGLAAAVVVGYIVYKSSKPKTQTQSGSDVTPPLDKKLTLESMATLYDSQEQPNTYQEVYNNNNTRESINIADLDCDRDGDVRKNCTNVKNQLVYTYMPPMSWKNSIIMPAQYTLEKDNMFYEYDVNGNFVRWSPKLEYSSKLK
jgi:hypothetical protein